LDWASESGPVAAFFGSAPPRRQPQRNIGPVSLPDTVVMLCLSADMESDPFRRALTRLETAIARVERAAASLPPAAPSTDPMPGDERLALLERRHARLRAGASDALARLDRLIGAQGEG
jgi:hypothetical protein